MWRSFLFNSLSCVRSLALCSLKAWKSCKINSEENMSMCLTLATVNFTFQYCRFQHTFLSFSYFVTDSSRAHCRDFTFTFALTASASFLNLRQHQGQTETLLVILCSTMETLLIHDLPILSFSP